MGLVWVAYGSGMGAKQTRAPLAFGDLQPI